MGFFFSSRRIFLHVHSHLLTIFLCVSFLLLPCAIVEKHSCLSSTFHIAIVSDTCFFFARRNSPSFIESFTGQKLNYNNNYYYGTSVTLCDRRRGISALIVTWHYQLSVTCAGCEPGCAVPLLAVAAGVSLAPGAVGATAAAVHRHQSRTALIAAAPGTVDQQAAPAAPAPRAGHRWNLLCSLHSAVRRVLFLELLNYRSGRVLTYCVSWSKSCALL